MRRHAKRLIHSFTLDSAANAWKRHLFFESPKDRHLLEGNFADQQSNNVVGLAKIEFPGMPVTAVRHWMRQNLPRATSLLATTLCGLSGWVVDFAADRGRRIIGCLPRR